MRTTRLGMWKGRSDRRGSMLVNPASTRRPTEMMRIERGDPADRQTAIVLLSKAVKLGDKEAQDLLQRLNNATRADY